MASTFSFDIVSEIDAQEADNAINQANKEIQQRYDLRGSNGVVEYNKAEGTVVLKGDGDHFVAAIYEIFIAKCIKRGISVLSLEVSPPENTGGKQVRQRIALKNGIEKEEGKKITAFIRDQKLKVQAQIQDKQVRVTGKSKDDLQTAIAALKKADLQIPLQFINYR